MNTGTVIRQLRMERKMSQQELADRAGVSFSFVNQVEGGKQTVRLDALNKLLAVFEYAMIPTSISSLSGARFQKDQVVPLHVSPPEPESSSPRSKNDWSFF